MRLPHAIAMPLDRPQGTSRARVEEAARALESQFASMMIKTMRSASPGDPFGGNSNYRDMYDQQLARELTKGRGLGLQSMIIRQLDPGASTGGPEAASGFLPLDRPATPLPMPGAAAVSGLPLPTRPGGGLLTLAPTRSGVSLPALGELPPAPAPAATESPQVCDESAPLDCSSPEAFVRSVWPHARKTAAELGVSAKALVAQAALETGWGRRLVGQEGNATSYNLFGIKAGGSWSGAKVVAATHEFVNGVRTGARAAFRSYASAADSFADYAQLLKRPRYAGALDAGGDVRQFASALQRAGYATDPSYAAKIGAIAEGATMRRALSGLEG